LNNYYGLVKKCVPKFRMLQLEDKDKNISYFTLSKTQFKSYMSSLNKEKQVYVSINYNPEKYKVFSNYISYKVDSLEKVQTVLNNEIKNLYINASSKDYIKSLLEKEEYKMFIDFEFTMPNVGQPPKSFKIEIIQAGIVILDDKDKIVYEYSNYIKTKYKITPRCMRFLDLDDEVLESSISQEEFYKDFKEIINIYNPTAYTWGGSDDVELNMFYKLNKFKPIKINSYDLSELIKKYYELPENIGLFRALKIFKDISVLQAHHALTDAAVTKEVYDSFKKEIATPIINVKDKLTLIKEQEKALKEERKLLRHTKKETVLETKRYVNPNRARNKMVCTNK